MARRARLDAELVRRGLARSRQHAAELIDGGRVLLDGSPASKPATQLDPARPVRVLDASDGTPEYVSRGGHKLAGALDALGAAAPQVSGRRALDAGASTGGFTDVLLRRGVAHVVAVDVGYGQLAWELRTDERVTVMDRTNIRAIDPETVQPQVDLIVGDLSFISLTLVLPALVAVATPEADLLLMVKPQFEVGKDRLGAGGVVRDPALHAEAVRTVVRAAAEHGLALRAVVASPLPGPSGNVEYFVHLSAGVATDEEAVLTMVADAITAGPAGDSR
ncbi:TlyA family RNA methyltransferase [Ruania halotolerans]|uniref:TlyA family RNA methyltransferase n=1 Tax=Ruania halotolerans TaxID=2897773 RepID=UPI001E31AC44|nr:TlyA family RNA methyltransferase [Ruania halotolerans]UFU05057.1 TlyA family RNA methyltransferase [Ruania halotolerans]